MENRGCLAYRRDVGWAKGFLVTGLLLVVLGLGLAFHEGSTVSACSNIQYLFGDRQGPSAAVCSNARDVLYVGSGVVWVGLACLLAALIAFLHDRGRPAHQASRANRA